VRKKQKNFLVSSDARRYRRNLVQFAKMIGEATGRNPLDYNGYGCFCGVGGFGKPVDNLDRHVIF
jgi:secretory phospholipase A2